MGGVNMIISESVAQKAYYVMLRLRGDCDMEKKYPRIDLDEAARRFANGHYMNQSLPGPNPERDKMVSEAIAKMKAENTGVKARQ
jgi:hypothetical protein